MTTRGPLWCLFTLAIICGCHSLQFQPVPLTGIGDSECALLLNGPGRSSHFDYSLNLLRGNGGFGYNGPHTCITYDAVNAAYIEARKRVQVAQPHGDYKPEDVATVGELLLDISVNLARTYGLTYEDIEKGLPLIDTSKTLIREVCPPFLSNVECRPGKYRRYDGLCTNLENPTWGATMQPFTRLIGPLYADGMTAPRISVTGNQLPLARVVSRTMHPDEGFHDHAGTVMVIAWGQFIDHDYTLTATPLDPLNRNDPEECCKRPPHLKNPYCNEIIVPEDDYFYRLWNVRCIDFVRGFPAARPGCRLGSRSQFNTLTGTLDANTVYGVSEKFARKLRSGYGGLLRMNPVFRDYGLKDLLPLKLDIPDEGCTRPNRSMYCFEAGEIRVNEQLVLTCMHTLMAREHNRVAQALAQVNPHWDDETLFQEARRINIAEIQHITYNEFLPILLGKEVMEKFGLLLQKDGYWDGYDTHVNPNVIDAFAAAAYRFGHSLLPTAVERWSKAHKFIASKRLSDLIRRPYDLYRAGIFDEYFMGLMNQVAQAMDDSITQEVTNHLFKKVGAKFGMDLVSFNMQRGREFGLPGYMEFRKFCGLPGAETFDDLFGSMPNDTVRRYSSIFEHPSDVDLWSGGVSERPLPGSMLGPTFACIIATQFSYSRRGDRFWYELPHQPSSFTPEQLQEIRKTRLARVICDNTDLIDTIQLYPMVLPDHEINPRVPCRSGVLPNIDFTKWADPQPFYNSTEIEIEKANLVQLEKIARKNTTKPLPTKPTPLLNGKPLKSLESNIVTQIIQNNSIPIKTIKILPPIIVKTSPRSVQDIVYKLSRRKRNIVPNAVPNVVPNVPNTIPNIVPNVVPNISPNVPNLLPNIYQNFTPRFSRIPPSRNNPQFAANLLVPKIIPRTPTTNLSILSQIIPGLLTIPGLPLLPQIPTQYPPLQAIPTLQTYQLPTYKPVPLPTYKPVPLPTNAPIVTTKPLVLPTKATVDQTPEAITVYQVSGVQPTQIPRNEAPKNYQPFVITNSDYKIIHKPGNLRIEVEEIKDDDDDLEYYEENQKQNDRNEEVNERNEEVQNPEDYEETEENKPIQKIEEEYEEEEELQPILETPQPLDNLKRLNDDVEYVDLKNNSKDGAVEDEVDKQNEGTNVDAEELKEFGKHFILVDDINEQSEYITESESIAEATKEPFIDITTQKTASEEKQAIVEESKDDGIEVTSQEDLEEEEEEQTQKVESEEVHEEPLEHKTEETQKIKEEETQSSKAKENQADEQKKADPTEEEKLIAQIFRKEIEELHNYQPDYFTKENKQEEYNEEDSDYDKFRKTSKNDYLSIKKDDFVNANTPYQIQLGKDFYDHLQQYYKEKGTDDQEDESDEEGEPTGKSEIRLKKSSSRKIGRKFIPEDNEQIESGKYFVSSEDAAPEYRETQYRNEYSDVYGHKKLKHKKVPKRENKKHNKSYKPTRDITEPLSLEDVLKENAKVWKEFEALDKAQQEKENKPLQTEASKEVPSNDTVNTKKSIQANKDIPYLQPKESLRTSLKIQPKQLKINTNIKESILDNLEPETNEDFQIEETEIHTTVEPASENEQTRYEVTTKSVFPNTKLELTAENIFQNQKRYEVTTENVFQNKKLRYELPTENVFQNEKAKYEVTTENYFQNEQTKYEVTTEHAPKPTHAQIKKTGFQTAINRENQEPQGADTEEVADHLEKPEETTETYKEESVSGALKRILEKKDAISRHQDVAANEPKSFTNYWTLEYSVPH